MNGPVLDRGGKGRCRFSIGVDVEEPGQGVVNVEQDIAVADTRGGDQLGPLGLPERAQNFATAGGDAGYRSAKASKR